MTLARALALSGIAGPLAFWTAVGLAGSLRPDYDHVRQTVSALGVGPSAAVMNLGFALYGALTVAFAFGLLRALGGTSDIALGPVLLALGGAAVAALAIAPAGTAAHGPLALLAFLAPALSALVTAAALPAALRRYRALLRVAGVIALGIIGYWASGAAGLEVAPGGPLPGLEERLEAVVLQLWTAGLALRLAREAQPSSAAAT